ncbi:hypothetical protein T07_9848 [Trichinella nelsoni]|uniref:Uncharacterized protein n=1 Tax=Trichinella nelsoni TaxID=6336 RepID=A0A0V0S7A4_9BILA|nr:hypothetical protein T07_7437 [Trichinella nelsoni]KRX22527.1 hypothetical protein T07_2219 [Trichinella nelsoni]KRX25659.1 hypothetical protein T07_9848 [Trichinella nelsoni]
MLYSSLKDDQSCIKSDTVGLKGVHVSITNFCCHFGIIRSFATSLETSVGRLPNRLDVRGGGVGEDAREWLLEVAIGLFIRHKD